MGCKEMLGVRGRVGGAHLVSGVKHFRKVLEVVLEDGG